MGIVNSFLQGHSWKCFEVFLEKCRFLTLCLWGLNIGIIHQTHYFKTKGHKMITWTQTKAMRDGINALLTSINNMEQTQDLIHIKDVLESLAIPASTRSTCSTEHPVCKVFGVKTIDELVEGTILPIDEALLNNDCKTLATSAWEKQGFKCHLSHSDKTYTFVAFDPNLFEVWEEKATLQKAKREAYSKAYLAKKKEEKNEPKEEYPFKVQN